MISHQAERETRPPPPILKTLSSQRKKNLVDAAMDILRDWRSSPFEFEGAVRHGIRSALCLEHWSWRDADHEASQTLGMAFRLLGVERPKWHEGQGEARDWNPKYGAYRRCANCGDLIDPDAGLSTCSAWCSKIMAHAKWRRVHAKEEAAKIKLRRVINPERSKAITEELAQGQGNGMAAGLRDLRQAIPCPHRHGSR